MNPFELQMSTDLQKLASDVIPSEELLKKANKCADQIIKLLQQKSKFDIGHVCIAGSTGKKTTIIDSDIDLVVFINENEPPFSNVLDDFENILTMYDGFKIHDVHTTKYSVQFKALDFDFDILPAANFTAGTQADGDDFINIQQQQVLKRIKRDPKKYGYMYSSSLAFSSVQFMKQQNGFVNEMVRIAKFWYKTLKINKLMGKKTCIEFVAVYAANQEQGMGTKSYLRSFVRFIQYLRNFDNLNIHFESNEHQVLDNSRPRVMDPVNPYNNLAKNWDYNSIQLIKQYANETEHRLNNLANARAPRLDVLFEPQPVFRMDVVEIFKGVSSKSNWRVGTITRDSRLPDLKIRNEDFRKDSTLWRGLEILKEYFQLAICTVRATSIDEIKIQEVIHNTINKQVMNTEYGWVPAVDEGHEDFDVTFTIPTVDGKAVQISYRK